MRLLFTSLITSSANVSVIVIIRITLCFPAPSEPSLQCIGSSSNGSDSRENIKTFDRLNRFNFGRFARPLASLVRRTPPYEQPLLIFSLRPRRPRRPHRSLVIVYVGHRVKVPISQEHRSSVAKLSRLMFSEIIAVYCYTHKQIVCVKC
jgi:hypothetical protein